MSQRPQTTNRRSWFRLERESQSKPESRINSNRNADRDRMLGSSTDIRSASQLQALEKPPNYDGMDLSQLPPIREAVLNHADIAQLFDDIAQLATDVVLMQRSANARRADQGRNASQNQLQLAQSALTNGTVSRLQIRYRWQNAQWIDTVERKDNEYRLVRVMHRASN